MLLVTGATGRVGASVIRHIADAMPMRAASRGGRPVEGASGVVFDMTAPATWPEAFAGTDALFLMRPPQIARRAVFARFLDAAAAAGLRRVVALSVIGADGNRILPHHGMEAEIMARDLDWTILRPSDFMQNLETVHRDAIRRRGEIAVPAGAGRSAFIDVEDIGAVAARVLTRPGHGGMAYDLTGPAALGFDEVAATLTRHLGRPVTYRAGNPLAFALGEIRHGTAPMMALVITALYTAQRLGKAARVTGTVEALLARPPGNLDAYVARSRDIWEPTPNPRPAGS